ncbi:MAG: hypothetical protein BWY99_02150 [Synergistetes bacterium ADurb.BinA166]|nr:MAG: hypothetical protein BWY99_02150 [Synergistetes bacterium ADurb.BinA166]
MAIRFMVRDGTLVQTANELSNRDFNQAAIDVRRPGASGRISGHTTGHGLCYGVTHLDGVTAYYDPDELTADGVPLDQLHMAAEVHES